MDQALQKEIFDLAKTIIERLTSAPVVVLVFIILFRAQIEAFFKSVSEPVGRVVESLLSRKFKLGLSKAGLQLEAESASAVIAQEKPLPSIASATVIEGGPVAKPGPVAASTGSTSATEEDNKRLEAVEAVKNVSVPPIVLEQERLLRTALKQLGIVDQQEQIGVLIRQLAVTQLWLRAEYFYRTIFGSQIQILKFLNTRPGSTKAELLGFYEQAKANFPKLYATYSFEQYLQYLLRGPLILEDAPDHYAITWAGREFLKWMTDQGLVETKLF
jgi:hypothetical protein